MAHICKAAGGGGQGVVSDQSIIFCCMEIRPAALATWILFSTKKASSSPMGNSWEMSWSLLLQNETVLHKGNGLIFMSLFQMNKLHNFLQYIVEVANKFFKYIIQYFRPQPWKQLGLQCSYAKITSIWYFLRKTDTLHLSPLAACTSWCLISSMALIPTLCIWPRNIFLNF